MNFENTPQSFQLIATSLMAMPYSGFQQQFYFFNKFFEGFASSGGITRCSESEKGGESRKQKKLAAKAAATQKQNMKNMNKTIVAAAVAVVLTTVNYAKADDQVYLSPRAQGNEFHATADLQNNDPDLVANRPTGNVRGWATAQSLVKTTDTDTVDLAHGPTPTITPRNPNYAQAVVAMREVQIAPLK